jgi:hypothetical protein
MQVPDPNIFAGPVRVRMKDESDWNDVPLVFPHEYGRSVGLADMAHAIRNGCPFRATGAQGYTVLDLVQGFLDSSASGRFYHPTAAYERPAPMPPSDKFGTFR